MKIDIQVDIDIIIWQQNKNSKQTTHIILDIHGIATNKRRRKQSTCSCCGALGHRKNSKSCPNHPANSN